MQETENEGTFRRAALPEVMFPADIALAMELGVHEAEAATRRGMFGPQFTVGGRPGVLRRDFLEFLGLRAAALSPAGKEVMP